MRHFAIFGTILLAYSVADAIIFSNKLNAEVGRFPSQWWEQLLKIKEAKSSAHMSPSLSPTSNRLSEKYLNRRSRLVKDRTTRVRRKTKDANVLKNALEKSSHPVVYQPKLKDQIPQLHDVLREVWRTLYVSSMHGAHPPQDFSVKTGNRKASNADEVRNQKSHLENKDSQAGKDVKYDAQRNSLPGVSKQHASMNIEDHLKPSVTGKENGFTIHPNKKSTRRIALQEHKPKIPPSQTNRRSKNIPKASTLPSTQEKDFRLHEDLAAPQLSTDDDDIQVQLISSNGTGPTTSVEAMLFIPTLNYKKEISPKDSVKLPVPIPGSNYYNTEDKSGGIKPELGAPSNIVKHSTRNNIEERSTRVNESTRNDAINLRIGGSSNIVKHPTQNNIENERASAQESAKNDAINFRKPKTTEHSGKGTSDLQSHSLQEKNHVSNNPFSFKIPIVPKYSQRNIDPSARKFMSRSKQNLTERKGKNHANSLSLKVNNFSQLRDPLPSKKNNTSDNFSPSTPKTSIRTSLSNVNNNNRPKNNKDIGKDMDYSKLLAFKSMTGGNFEESLSSEKIFRNKTKVNNLSLLRHPLKSKKNNPNDNLKPKIPMTTFPPNVTNNNPPSRNKDIRTNIDDSILPESMQIFPKTSENLEQISSQEDIIRRNNLLLLRDHLPSKKANTNDNLKPKISTKISLPDVRVTNNNHNSLNKDLSRNEDDSISEEDMADENFEQTSHRDDKTIMNNFHRLHDSMAPNEINSNNNYSSLKPKTNKRITPQNVNNNNFPLKSKDLRRNADYLTFPENTPIVTLRDENFGQMPSRNKKSDDKKRRNNPTQLRGPLAPNNINSNDDYPYPSFRPKANKIIYLPNVNNNRPSKNKDLQRNTVYTTANKNVEQIYSSNKKSNDKIRRNEIIQNIPKQDIDFEKIVNGTKMSLKDVFEIVSKEHGYDKKNPNFKDIRDNWEKTVKLSGIIHNQIMPNYSEPEYDRLKAFYLVGHQNALYLSRNLDKILNDNSSRLLDTPMAQNGVRYAHFFGSGSLNPVTNDWLYKNRKNDLHV